MHPILFQPFGLPIYGYGTMLCLSVVLGRLLALHLAEGDGLDRATMSRCCAWVLAGAFVGARLLYVITNLDQFDRLADAFAWWKGGVVAYGGFLGGFLGTVVFCRAAGVGILAWADCAAPALCLGLALTRVGCLLGGCDFGRPWDGPWAVQFPTGSPAFQEQVLLGLLPPAAPRSLPVHPTQVYESLAGLALLGLALALRQRRRFVGQPFLAVVLGYSMLRYAIEMVRADPGRGTVGPFSTSQFIAIVTFLAAAASLYVLRRQQPPVPLPAGPRPARTPASR